MFEVKQMAKCFYIGLDVHDAQTTYVVRSWDGAIVKEGSCSTTFRDLWSAIEPYAFNCRVGMEACTCFYPLYHGFKDKGIPAFVANVLKIRRLIAKDDKLDAARLSDMLRLGTFPESFIPCETIQKLRSLVGMRHGFVRQETQHKNKIHALLKMAGIRISVKTPFCIKWCDQLRHYIAKVESFELRYLLEAQQDAEKRGRLLDLEIIDYTKKHFPKDFENLQTIPGIGPIWAAYIIAHVMPVSRFRNKKKLRRYAGIIPVSDKSDTTVYRTYLPKTCSRKPLRHALIQAAHTAVKVKGNLKLYFNKKKKQKKLTQKAILCVAASMADIAFTVLTTGKPYTA